MVGYSGVQWDLGRDKEGRDHHIDKGTGIHFVRKERDGITVYVPIARDPPKETGYKQ